MKDNFFISVVTETAEAKERWHFMEGGAPKSLWNQVLTEEIGKLNRACNKLTMATDDQVRRGFTQEAKYRLVTVASICQRFYEVFDSLPDSAAAYSCLRETTNEG